MNCKGPGCLTKIDEVARLTDNGIYQVVALTCESPLDRHVNIGTSNRGGAGECAWCGLSMTTEVGVYEESHVVPIFQNIIFFIYFASHLIFHRLHTCQPIQFTSIKYSVFFLSLFWGEYGHIGKLMQENYFPEILLLL